MRAEDMVEVGEKWEEPKSGERRVVATLHLAKVGDHALLVESAPGATGQTLTGRLEEMTFRERSELSNALRADNPRLVNMVLPVRLTTTKNAWAEEGWLVALLAAGLVLALGKIVQGVGRLRDPGAHPSMRALAAYGGMFANSRLIDAEVAASPATVGSTTLTKSWLLHPATYALQAAPLAEVVWFYKKVTKHYHNFIPVGKTYELIVHTGPAKRPLCISTREKHVDQLLTELSGRAPWAVAGYTKELEAAMAGPQRAQLVTEVHERRRQAKSAA